MQRRYRNLRATREMKVCRDWIRGIVRFVKADPYLEDVSQNLSVRIVRWHPVSHNVLVCIRDVTRPETPYTSQYCRWVFVSTWASSERCSRISIWKEINEVILSMRHENFHLPF